MNSAEKLVMMANQIAANLALEANPAAVVAEHMICFWDPRMKEMIGASNIEGLSQVAKNAVKLVVKSSGQ